MTDRGSSDSHEGDIAKGAEAAARFLGVLEDPEVYRLALELKAAAEAYVCAAIAVPEITPGMALSSALGVVVKAVGID